MNYRLSVSIVVQRPEDGKILTVTNRRWGGFSVPGGKVDPGESFYTAAKREFLEETGCEARNLRALGAHTHMHLQSDPEKDSPWLCMGFLADIEEQEPQQVEEGTVPEWRSPDEVVTEGLYRGWYEWFFPIANIPFKKEEWR